MKYKIRKQESNKDFWFYLAFYVVTGIVVGLIFWFLVWVGFRCIDSYNNALNVCIDKGYTESYCKNMLN